MRTTLLNRLLLVLLLAAVVFFLRYSSAAPGTAVCEQQLPATSETARPQLLWESLSRQFVSFKAY